MKKILLTGATGLVGSHISREIISKNLELKIFVRSTSNLKWLDGLKYEIFRGSLSETADWEKALHNTDLLIHCAGLTSARSKAEYFRTNRDLCRIPAQLCAEKGIPFLLISSEAAVGPSIAIDQPVDETTPEKPITNYGESKLAGEKIIRSQKNLKWVIIRPPAVYGPRDTDVFQFFRMVNQHYCLLPAGHERYASLSFVEDVAKLAVLAAQNFKPGSIYYPAHEEILSWRQIADITAKIMQKKYITIPLPVPVAWLYGVLNELLAGFKKQPALVNRQKVREMIQTFWTVSIHKAQQDLNFEPVSVKIGISKTIEWYYQNNWLKR